MGSIRLCRKMTASLFDPAYNIAPTTTQPTQPAHPREPRFAFARDCSYALGLSRLPQQRSRSETQPFNARSETLDSSGLWRAPSTGIVVSFQQTTFMSRFKPTREAWRFALSAGGRWEWQAFGMRGKTRRTDNGCRATRSSQCRRTPCFRPFTTGCPQFSTLWKSKEYTAAEIAQQFSISEATFFRRMTRLTKPKALEGRACIADRH